eukprot:1855587-Pleurochrysis_carterae.AAC.3
MSFHYHHLSVTALCVCASQLSRAALTECRVVVGSEKVSTTLSACLSAMTTNEVRACRRYESRGLDVDLRMGVGESCGTVSGESFSCTLC